MKRQLQLFPVNGHTFPYESSVPPKGWEDARTDPDFQGLLETTLNVGMNERTVQEVETEVVCFLRDTRLSHAKRFAYAS